MKIIKPLVRSTVIIAWLIFLANYLTIANAQSNNSRIAYIQSMASGGNRIIVLDQGESYSFDVSTGYCFKLSPDLESVALVNEANPTQLQIYNIKSGNTVLHVVWHSDWHWNCGFEWRSTQKLMIWTEVPPNDDTLYEISLSDQSITGPQQVDEIPVLPNYDPDNTDSVASPSEKDFVYSYCEAVNYQSASPQCINWEGFVIYSTEQQHIITKLDDTLPPSARPLSLSLFYAWSPSGRYLAYMGITKLIDIYDMKLNQYINTDFVNNYPQSMGARPSGLLWSPDESKVAMAVTTNDPVSDGIAIIDLETRTLSVLDITSNNWPYNWNSWIWASDAKSLVIVNKDNDLIRVDLSGKVEHITDNVSKIYAWEQ